MRGLARLCVLIACLGLGVAPAARANRPVLSEALLETVTAPVPLPPPEAQVQGACGLAASSVSVYVSDYYHRVIDNFSLGGEYRFQIAFPGGPITGEDSNSLDGVCGLALAPSGELYGNEWHQGVLRLKPTMAVFDTGESTGVAVDGAGRVYVDDRTYLAVYEPSGEPVEVSGHPLLIGEGSLGDAYGLAVAPDGSRVYVPDAASGTVKVFEPEGDPATAVAEISPPGGFTSLLDATLALDPTNGHLVVAENIQPGYEHPGAALHEFGPPPSYLYLGRLACAPVDGEPSGVAFDPAGNLYVTNGNSAGSNVFKYAPYTSTAVPVPGCHAGAAPAAFTSASSAARLASAAGALAGEGTSTPSDTVAPPGAARRQARRVLAQRRSAAQRRARHRHRTHRARPSRLLRRHGGDAALVQKGSIRVALEGDIAPTRLPRDGAAPISLTVGGRISTTDPSHPPQLRKVSFAFNRAGRLDTKGLPRCRRTDIDPSSTAQALAACRGALVGEGHFAAAVRLPEQSPFPSQGKVTAFNGAEHGRPVLFAHIYGKEPVPTSIVLPLRIRHGGGRFATHLEASLAGLTGDWGYVKSIALRLGRTYSAGGRRHSFLSAGCPAPAGFPGAVFPLTRASFGFAGGMVLRGTLTRSCTVGGH